MDTATSAAAIEAARMDMLASVNQRFDRLREELLGSGRHVEPTSPFIPKMPTSEDGRDPRNKSGHNLTGRGAEILYRMFDQGAGYNRAAKMLDITQAAAKNRKRAWEKLGGKDRKKQRLDIDN